MTTLEQLTEEIVAFRDERDWDQFHKPHHLAAAISIEAGELQELFLWRDVNEVATKLDDSDFRAGVEREIADVLIYALLLCESLDTSPSSAIHSKLEENAEKYPVDEARGRAEKYTKLD